MITLRKFGQWPMRKILALSAFVYVVVITLLLVALSAGGVHIDPAVISVVQLTMLEMLGPIIGYYFSSSYETKKRLENNIDDHKR